MSLIPKFAPAVRLYVDTEFNGKKGALLSMGLYDPITNKEWYNAVKMEAEYNPWVKDHVVPVLHTVPLEELEFIASFQDFITQYSFVEFVYNDNQDGHYLRQVIRSVKGMPAHRYTRDGGLCSKHAVIPHNALSDAKAMVDHVLGTATENEHGFTDRAVMTELWKLGHRFDLRECTLSYDVKRTSDKVSFVRVRIRAKEGLKNPNAHFYRTFTGSLILKR